MTTFYRLLPWIVGQNYYREQIREIQIPSLFFIERIHFNLFSDNSIYKEWISIFLLLDIMGELKIKKTINYTEVNAMEWTQIFVLASHET